MEQGQTLSLSYFLGVNAVRVESPNLNHASSAKDVMLQYEQSI